MIKETSLKIKEPPLLDQFSPFKRIGIIAFRTTKHVHHAHNCFFHHLIHGMMVQYPSTTIFNEIDIILEPVR